MNRHLFSNLIILYLYVWQPSKAQLVAGYLLCGDYESGGAEGGHAHGEVRALLE